MKTLQALLIGFVLAWGGWLSAADYYVDITNAGGHEPPYTNWPTAATNIQFAVNEAGAGDTVWVRPGQYRVPTNAVVYNGVTNVVHLDYTLDGITLRGDGPREQIVIDGEGKYRCVMAVFGPGADNLADYPYNFHNLTISNGWAAADGGAGIFYALSDATWTSVVENCVITHNQAAGAGGGIHAYGNGSNNRLKLVVTNSVLRNNESTTVGGAMYLRMMERSTIVDSYIQNNQADDGAALDVYGGHDIERCVFSGNVAAGDGGVLAGIPLGTVFRNCLLYANRAYQGGAIYLKGGRKVDVYSSTITSNRTVTGASAAIHLDGTGDTLWMNNSILALNSDDKNLRDPGASLAVSNNCSPELVGIGTDNIGGDPGFVDSGGYDFHLTTASPCLDEGLNEDWMIGATDLDGNPRLDGKVGIVDMGCYERLYRGTMVLIQ